jgi:glycosidase
MISDATTTEKNTIVNFLRRHGDIQGIINNLDYMLGFRRNYYLSTPLCEDNDKEYSYHGYGQSDVYKIDPRYGTNDDYVRLAAALHKKHDS